MQLHLIMIVWRDLSYHKFNKKIIEHCYGRLVEGELMAILGPSGAGKTTLLKLLGQRNPGGVLSGTINYNEKILTGGCIRMNIGFVYQDDVFSPFLSPREIFHFAFLLHKGNKEKNVDDLVETLLKKLGLDDCADVRGGGWGSSILSGGEKRRISIGLSLINNPYVLLLDEPTSGLDSANALRIMTLLKSLAQSGMAIGATLHQPRNDILTQVDTITLICKGRTVIQGTIETLMESFRTQGIVCRNDLNPADFMLDQLDKEPNLLLLNGGVIPLSNGQRENFNERTLVPPQNVSLQTTSYLWQLGVLGKRSFTILLRDRIFVLGTIIRGVVLGLLFGASFWRLGISQTSIQNRIGILFLLPVNQGFLALIPGISYLPLARPLLVREQSTTRTRLLAWLPAQLTAESLITLTEILISSSIVYWMAGLQPFFYNWFIATALLLLSTSVSSGIGYLTGAMLPSVKDAQLVAPLLVVVALLYGGNSVNVDTLPVFLRWLPYISFINYTYRGLAQNEFDGLIFDCDTNDARCIRTGEDVLSLYSLSSIPLYKCFIILTIMNLILYSSTAIALKINTRMALRLPHRVVNSEV